MAELGGEGGLAQLNLQIYWNIGQSSAFFTVEGGIIIWKKKFDWTFGGEGGIREVQPLS